MRYWAPGGLALTGSISDFNAGFES